MKTATESKSLKLQVDDSELLSAIEELSRFGKTLFQFPPSLILVMDYLSSIRSSLLALSVFSLLGCASTPPLTNASGDSSAKLFAVNAESGKVYVYADFAAIHTHNIPVVLGTQIIAQLGGGTYLVADLKPGTYQFTSVGGADNPPYTLRVEAGHVYFLRMKQLYGWGYLGGAQYFLSTDAEGQRAILQRKRVPVTPPTT